MASHVPVSGAPVAGSEDATVTTTQPTDRLSTVATQRTMTDRFGSPLALGSGVYTAYIDMRNVLSTLNFATAGVGAAACDIDAAASATFGGIPVVAGSPNIVATAVFTASSKSIAAMGLSAAATAVTSWVGVAA